MAPKKKPAKAETPEQIAAKRAAAMAMFNTSSTPAAAAKPAATHGQKKPAAAKPEVAEKQLEALDISDNAAAEPAKGDIFSDGGEDVRKDAVAYAASTFGLGGDALSTSLPIAEAGWVKILSMEPTEMMKKKAKKEGELQTVDNDCKLYVLKDVAYLYDAEGRTNAACWRTKLQGANLGTGEQPRVRHCGGKQKLLVGKRVDGAGLMERAIATHTGVTMALLPTGHVSVLGGEEATEAAVVLIDDLLDGEGALAKETLAALLVEKAPWCGELHVPCTDEWVGAVIGKHGAGLKAIMNETSVHLEYVDPEEAAEGGEGASGAGGAGGAGGAEGEVGAEGAAGTAAATNEGAADAAAPVLGYFRIRGKFENDCRLAAKRIEERLALVQRLDVHGQVMVPRACVGRLIGKGGANIKLLQRESGASRLTFDKEPGGRATTQACTVIAGDIEGAVEAAKVVLDAVPLDSPDAREVRAKRLEDWAAIVHVLQGGEKDAPPPADATREMAVAAHRKKFGTECLAADQQTKAVPADLAAVDFDVWRLQWANADDRVFNDGGGKKR